MAINIVSEARSFNIISPARESVVPISIDPILWDDGTEILWDDGSTIVWDTTINTIGLNSTNRSFNIISPERKA